MKAEQVRNGALAIVAIAAAAGILYKPFQYMVAQEVKKQQAPAVEQLSEIKELLRRDSDREELKFCMEHKYLDLDVQARERVCQKESDYRWAMWAWQDCLKTHKAEECGPKPEKPNV